MLETARVLLSAKLKTYPSFFYPIAKLRENNKRRVVRRDTDVAIEGYWRCGNHFATYAFLCSQKKEVQVAHHFHAPAQLMLAVRWKVPAILLIREPLEAIASATVFLDHTDPLPFIMFYNIFHSAVLGLADEVVVSDFPRTIDRFGGVIAAVNKRYKKSYQLFGDTDQQREEVERCIRGEHTKNMGAASATLPLPSDEKARRKKLVRKSLLAPRCSAQLEQAKQLYETLKIKSVRD